MYANEGRVEVELQSVRLRDGEREAVAIVAPLDARAGCPLWVGIGEREARALLCELQGQETSRVQALVLSAHIAELLQGRLIAGVLVPSSKGTLRAVVQLATPGGLVEVPTEPGHALAAAAWLHLALFADRRLFQRPEPEPGALSVSVAAFLGSLDLTGLDGSGASSIL